MFVVAFAVSKIREGQSDSTPKKS